MNLESQILRADGKGPESGQAIAFFDLDYTLIPYDTLLLLCNFVLKKAPWRLFYMSLFSQMIPFAVLKLVGSQTLKRVFLSFLWRMKREKLESICEEFVQKQVMPRVYPDILAILEDHRQKGDYVILNTASPYFYVKYIAREFKVDACIATEVEVPERMPLLPRFTARNNKNFIKLIHMRDLLPADVREKVTDELTKANTAERLNGAQVPGSWAYSDSPADLPMLRLAENAKLVNPLQSEFIQEAEEKGWEILQPKTPYKNKGQMYRGLLRQSIGLY